eukprot:Hpha_TRINITY_DN16919_c2_g1::TRINITY_DN16919_c2_g1_i11::g.56433::m.56433
MTTDQTTTTGGQVGPSTTSGTRTTSGLKNALSARRDASVESAGASHTLVTFPEAESNSKAGRKEKMEISPSDYPSLTPLLLPFYPPADRSDAFLPSPPVSP